MAFRVSFIWSQQSAELKRWTENFWLNTSNATLAGTKSATLRDKLNVLKGNQCYCPNYTIQNLDVFRDALPVAVEGAQPTPNDGPSDTFDADYPGTALRIRLRGSGNLKVTQWLRGIPDKIVARSGTKNLPGIVGYTTRLAALWAELSTAPWSIHVLDPAVKAVAITAIDPATGIVTTGLAHGITEANNKVRISRCKGLTAANGIWRATILSEKTFQLLQWIPTTQPLLKSNAQMRRQVYVFQQITAGEVIQVTSRYTGTPGKKRRSGGRRKTA